MGVAGMLKGKIRKVSGGGRVSDFSSRVIAAARSAGFSEAEIGRLFYVLESFETREKVIARGMASTIELASLSAGDSAAIREIIERAHASISGGGEPLKSDLKKLQAILSNSTISSGAKRRMFRELERNLNVVERLWSCVGSGNEKLSARPSKSERV